MSSRPDVLEALAEARKAKYILELDQRICHLQQAKANVQTRPPTPLRSKEVKTVAKAMETCGLTFDELVAVVEAQLAHPSSGGGRGRVAPLSNLLSGLGRIGDGLTLT